MPLPNSKLIVVPKRYTLAARAAALSNTPMPTSPIRPSSIKAPLGSRWLEITWQSGQKHRLSTVVLRGYCPCAGCQGHSGPIEFVAGHDAELVELAQVGNYALQFDWGDGHSSGIYTFEYLHRLGELYLEHGDTLPTACPALSKE